MIHILHHGYPLCLFTSRPPNDWPEGHLWVGLVDWWIADCPGCQAWKAALIPTANALVGVLK